MDTEAGGKIMTIMRWLCGFALLLLTACKMTDVASWTEEVRLHDGRTVLVKRVARAKSIGFPEPRGADIDNEFSYRPLNAHWRGQAPANLMSFEIFGGIPYLVVYDANCKNKQPGQFKASFLRWVNGRWEVINQAQYPATEGLMNLYAGYWGHSRTEDASGLVTWEQKAREDGFDPSKPDTVDSWYRNFHRLC